MTKGYKKRQQHQSPANNDQRLFEIADSQQGFFTAKQAVSAGYSEKNHAFHIRAGNWIRELHGVYRLRAYPQSPDSNLVLWSLWSRGKDGEPQGVYSHETVLSHFDLSDVNPSSLQMTVPKDFRRSAKLPSELTLHKAALPKGDIRQMRGYRMTTVKRAIEDVVRAGTLSKEIVQQAIQDALKSGHLSIVDFEKSEVLRPYHTTLRISQRRIAS